MKATTRTVRGVFLAAAVAAAVVAQADTVSNIYTVVVSGGTLASPVSIEDQEVEIYDAEAGTTTTASFPDVTFKANSIFRKRGSGYMLSSLKMKNFTGEIRIEEGAFVINTNNQMGVTTAAANAPYIVVSNGASFVSATRSNTCAARALKIYNSFQIAGDGCDGCGAICIDNATEQTDYLFYRRVTLSEDATIGSTKSGRFDFGGSNCVIDLAGHQLTIHRTGSSSGNFCMNTCSITNSAVAFSRILVDNHRLQLQGGTKFFGDARNEVVFTNSATLFVYGAGITNAVSPWTLRFTGNQSVQISTSASTPRTMSSGLTWQGPVVLDGAGAVPTFIGNKNCDGMIFSNEVSGAGGILARNATIQLANPTNSFAGSVGIWTDNPALTGNLVLWHPWSLPPSCAGLFVTNSTVTLFPSSERYALPSMTVHVKDGTSSVFAGGGGGFAPSFRKSGLGRLDMENPLTVTGRAEVAEGMLKFSRYARAGLVAGRFQMPNRTDFYLPANRHWDSISAAAHDTAVTLTNWVECVPECLTTNSAPLGYIPADTPYTDDVKPGVIVMFNGYIWNRSGETQRWTFGGGAGTHLNVWIDSTKLNRYTQYQTGVKTTLNVTPGAHRLRITSYNGGNPPIYVEPAGTAFTNMSWRISSSLGAGFRYDPQGRDSTDYNDYLVFGDPGDGSLLTVSNDDSMTDVQDEPSFWTLRLGTGATLDTFGNGIMVGDLEGLGTVTNSNAYYVHPLTVTNSWKVSAADVVSGGALRMHVPLAFADGAKFIADDLENFPRSLNDPLVLCIADEPIDGMPVFDSKANATTRKWRLEKSADGRTIQFCYSSGFVITYR